MSITWIDRGLAKQRAAGHGTSKDQGASGGPDRWALILAAGSGTRLEGLTRLGNGAAVPKQFCSLKGGASLVEETIQRARAITPPERTIVVVAAEHREFWAQGLRGIPDENVVVQPANRGTAFGILLGVAVVLDRDPDAGLLVLPSDHYIGQEDVVRQAIARAFGVLGPASRTIRFLGIRPEHADPGLGYIVRGAPTASGSYGIARFVEKPSDAEAAALIAQSALWNSFILVGRAHAFVELIAQRFPGETSAMLRVIGHGSAYGASAETLGALYATLPNADFSRDVVQRSHASLEVVAVGSCDWSDLGTPERVAACLARVATRPVHLTAHLSLAEAQLRYAHAAV